MHSYSVRDVERVLRLSRSTIRGLIEVGFVKPARGPRRQYRFSFQDLIVLRVARTLIQAKVSRRRIRRTLQDLRRHLPETMPLSGLSISAVGDQVVVRDGRSHFRADSGQYLLGFDVSMQQGVLRVVERQDRESDASSLRSHTAARRGSTAGTAKSGEDWFEEALALEEHDPPAAIAAYRRAVHVEPAYVSAWINWGRLLHEQSRPREAEAVYRRALLQCGPAPVLMFNLGVVLEDLHRQPAAIEAYQAAIGADPDLAEAHYNLARLYEALGKPQHAIRHLGQYRRLVMSESR